MLTTYLLISFLSNIDLKKIFQFSINYIKETIGFYILIFLLLSLFVFLIRSLSNEKSFHNVKFLWLLLISIFSIQVYFLLKCFAITQPYLNFWNIEDSIWKNYIIPFIGKIQDNSFFWNFLDFFYISFWSFSCSLILIAFFLKYKKAKNIIYSLSLAYLFTGILYILFPIKSPYYIYEKEFSFLKQKATKSFYLHQKSEEVTNSLKKEGIKKTISSLGYPIQPIVAFPSFHITYAVIISYMFYLLYFYKHKKIGMLAGFLYIGGTSFSAILLGFHWLLDVIFGLLIAFFVIFCVNSKTLPGIYPRKLLKRCKKYVQ